MTERVATARSRRRVKAAHRVAQGFLTAAIIGSGVGILDPVPGPIDARFRTPAADAQTCGTACTLFNGGSLVRDTGTPFPGIVGHAETSTVIWNGRYLMFYRTFVSASGAVCSGRPQGIAVAASSDRGASWRPLNRGIPLSGLRSRQFDTAGRIVSGCLTNDEAKSDWVYAPNVIADGSRLVMAYERRDKAGPGSRAMHSVWIATSTDAMNWTGFRKLLSPGSATAWDAEIGTPDIERDGGGYVVSFHGHRPNATRQGRGLVRMRSINDEYRGTRTQIRLTTTPAWAGFGPGLSDMTKDPDGNWYAVFEGFVTSGDCATASTSVGIARSTNLVDWSVRPDALLPSRPGCGHDMPNFQNVGAVKSVVTPAKPPAGPLVRWLIKPAPGGTRVRPSGASPPVVDPPISDPAPPPPPPAADDRLSPGEAINPGQFVASSDGRYVLRLQGDGNLVLYAPGNVATWSSETNGTSVAQAVMQGDGNLVLYSPGGVAVCSTGTQGNPGAFLKVQTDGNTVVYSASGAALWHTRRGDRCQ